MPRHSGGSPGVDGLLRDDIVKRESTFRRREERWGRDG